MTLSEKGLPIIFEGGIHYIEDAMMILQSDSLQNSDTTEYGDMKKARGD